MAVVSSTNSFVCGVSSVINDSKPYILANIATQCEDKESPRLAMFGAPGTGKSAIIKQICIENGYALKCVYLSNLTDDQTSGIPCRIVNGEKAQYTPSELISIDEENLTYCPPNYEKGKTITVLLLDDVHLCSKGMQKYLFQLLSYGAINGYRLPDNVAIVLAGNRTNDRACATSICAPVMNRLFVIEVHSNHKDWLMNYAFKNGIRTDITSFLHSEMGGVLLCGQPLENVPWASPRSWAFFSKQLDSFEKQSGTPSLENLRVIANGFLGQEIGARWIEHREMIAKWDVQKMGKMKENEVKAYLQDSFTKNPATCQGMVQAVMSWLLDTGIKSKFNAKAKNVAEGLKTAYNLLATAITIKAENIQIRPIVISGMSYLSDYKKTITNSSENKRFMEFLTDFVKGMEEKRPQDWVMYDTFITLFQMEYDKGDEEEIAKAKKALGLNK